MAAPGKYATGTKVTVESSRNEIERTLKRYGADEFIYGERASMAVIGFRAAGRHVKFTVPYEADISDAERRRRWRCLALMIKAKLEAVATGIVLFEDEFLSHIVMPDGRTVGDHIRPSIAIAYESGKMQPLLPDFSNG